MNANITINYYGHACFLVTVDGVTVLFDPFDAPLFQGRFRYEPPRCRADYTICSHDHADHCTIPAGVDPGRGPVTESLLDDKVDISFFPAPHDLAGGVHLGQNNIVRLRTSGVEVVHCGDLAAAPGEDVMTAIQRPDILFVPVGGNYTMDHQGAMDLARHLRPRLVVPMHFRTRDISLPLDPPLYFLCDSPRVLWHGSGRFSCPHNALPQPPWTTLFMLPGEVPASARGDK